MPSVVELASVPGLSDINRIAEQVVKGSSGENRAASTPPIGSDPLLAPIAIRLEVVVEIEDGSEPKILIEDVPDLFRFCFVDMELSILVVIAKRDNAAHPHALLLRGRDLVANAFPVTSRSNWANERRTFRVSRPIDVVVLNCCVTETKLTPLLSNVSMILAKSAREG
jgi:hypothetical protein